jgi:hypothetical protein
MWHYIRFTILWFALSFILVYYDVPLKCQIAVFVMINLFILNEIHDCAKRWLGV